MRGSRPPLGCLPQTKAVICTLCGTANTATAHPCTLKCLLCGQAHQTGDKTCPQRYQTPRLLIYCRQEKAKLQQQQYLSTMISTQDAHPERQKVKPSDTRSRSTSPTSNRRGSRSRSKQRRKNQPQELRLGSAAPEASDGPPLQQRQPSLTLATPTQNTHNLGYTLITDPAHPTRLGNRVARDTTPYLAFTANITHAEWSNLHEHLGSDGYIMQTIVKAGPQRRKYKQPTLFDWDVFRELRATASLESATSIDQWTASLLRDVKRATKTPPEDAVGHTVDTKLLHMWEVLAGLRKRYNSNKSNHSLHKRIAISRVKLKITLFNFPARTGISFVTL
ncbi:hypothetical protein HPB51_006239 [Rhipicephalus microplus]|uniref:Uncharacterized protein n=1 Tax=Rhipicephalus microplus TaxID=6941 RepID=A0A9J6DLV1_RHIMP|nr:hypothetical protein HPB51_006239 [Rhipicephalus microplus]